MIRGPDVAVGVPKAAAPIFWGTRHGVPAIPQTAVEVERENCVVRTPLMLPWFNALNASPMNCKRTRSVNCKLRVTRGSRETVVGK